MKFQVAITSTKTTDLYSSGLWSEAKDTSNNLVIAIGADRFSLEWCSTLTYTGGDPLEWSNEGPVADRCLKGVALLRGRHCWRPIVSPAHLEEVLNRLTRGER